MIAGLMAGLAATAGLRAGRSPQTEPFRAAVELVRLDFLALSEAGRPVADLTPGDVTLKVDGRTRDIRSFQYVRLGDPVPSPRSRVPAKLLPPPFGTNALDASGRTVVIIIKTDSIRANVVRQATGGGRVRLRAVAERLGRARDHALWRCPRRAHEKPRAC